MAVLKGLKPEKVFAYFEKLCSVPHGSGNTKIISDLCVDFAKELGLKYRQEPCNNVVIWKPASPGHESAEPIILQGHIDMVCAKTDDCTKDMTREGLDLMTDGEWVWADKTSLGGDNCIAVAMILAILSDDTLVHPPIEAVFTVDEEVGMDGAFALDCSDLKGKKLLNLDSELEGVFTVSCAGGMRSDCLLPAALTDAAGMEGFGITVAGLRGGHSGADIHLGRGSGNRLMGRVLATALEKFPGLRLAAISGGQFDNVICSRCDAAVALPKGSGRAFEAFIREFEGVLKNEYAVTDPDVTLTCAAAETAKSRVRRAHRDAGAGADGHAAGRGGYGHGFPRSGADIPEYGRGEAGRRRTAHRVLHPVVHRVPEADAGAARAGCGGAGGRHCGRAGRVPRLAVQEGVAVPGYAAGGV